MSKRNKKPLEFRKSRDAKRKQLRLAREGATNILGSAHKNLRRDIQLSVLNQPSQEKLLFGVVTGTFGSPGVVAYPLSYESIVGMVEERAAFAAVVNNVGLLALAALVRHNLAEGVEGLPRKIYQFAGIDLDALQKEADADGAAVVTPAPAPEPSPLAPGVVL